MNPEDINKLTQKIKESMTDTIKSIATQAATEAINASTTKMEKVRTSINKNGKADSVTFTKKHMKTNTATPEEALIALKVQFNQMRSLRTSGDCYCLV